MTSSCRTICDTWQPFLQPPHRLAACQTESNGGRNLSHLSKHWVKICHKLWWIKTFVLPVWQKFSDNTEDGSIWLLWYRSLQCTRPVPAAHKAYSSFCKLTHHSEESCLLTQASWVGLNCCERVNTRPNLVNPWWKPWDRGLQRSER